MPNNIYSVYDRVRGVYDSPFVEPNDECAKRAFLCACSDPRAIYIYADLDLFKIGEFENDTGKINPCQPKFICRGERIYPEEMYTAGCTDKSAVSVESEDKDV